jgi:hypothetical protein
MVIGNGDIAKALTDAGIDAGYVTFFASGVSNSRETRKEVYQREADLLNGQNINRHLVYFSSLSIYYSDSVYTHHKRTMEWRVTNGFNSYTIIRLGNITWGNNPNTIVNYFKDCHAKGITPELQDTYRYLITKDEFIHWVKMIRVGEKDIMNIPGEMVSINEIWRRVQDGKY